jgi:SAM-dependent methyltransferase
MQTMHSAQDRLNRATWETPHACAELEHNERYTDAGERAAIDEATRGLSRRPILDLGVGLGRTVPLLEPLTNDYRALDYTPLFIGIARQRYPFARIDLGDARDLAAYPPAHFGLVSFTFNGIDAVCDADRRRILDEVSRVVAPGGVFWFSTLNLDGPGYRTRPWHIDLPRAAGRVVSPLRFAARFTKTIAWTPLHVINWMRFRSMREEGSGYGVAPLSACHWRIVAHFTTLAHALDELEDAGFSRDAVVFDNKEGARLPQGADTSRYDWLHIVARKK